MLLLMKKMMQILNFKTLEVENVPNTKEKSVQSPLPNGVEGNWRMPI